MPAAILTQDLLSMSLYIGEGNININMESLVRRFELFQEKHRRYFGVTPLDLRNLFYRLTMWELDVKKDLDHVSLSEIWLIILNYLQVYFNDEGEQWNYPDFDVLTIDNEHMIWFDYRFYLYEEQEYLEKFNDKKKLKVFLSDPKNHTPYAIMNFLPSINVSEELLFLYSHPGSLI